jgi:hypothetical protein
MKSFNHSQSWVPRVRILGPGKAQAIAIRFAAVALLLIPSGLLSSAQQTKPWEAIPIPQLHAFHPQQPKRIELKNGIVVFSRKITSSRLSTARC